MDIVFDPAKNAANIAKPGVSFEEFKGFDDDPEIDVDTRFDYGETRYIARGRIGGMGYCLVFTSKAGRIRAISFRRAHEKEMRRYGQATPSR